ncbi:MAG: Rne/Rng family ribonuclease [Marmoricola sp.]
MSDELSPTDNTPAPEAAPVAADPVAEASDAPAKPAKKAAAKKTAAKKAPAKKAAAKKAAAEPVEGEEKPQPKKKAASKPKKVAEAAPAAPADGATETEAEAPAKKVAPRKTAQPVLFQAPEPVAQPVRKKTVPAPPKDEADKPVAEVAEKPADAEPDAEASDDETGEGGEGGEGAARRRPRRRGGRRRRKPAGAGGDSDDDSSDDEGDEDELEDADADNAESGEGGSRRTRTRNRAPKSPEDEIASVNGSTRLEAKKQRRREGREAGRRRAPIVSEAEFLARREAVDRVMVIRQREALTQIGVLEDNVLVEHYVSRESQASMIGNVYLGRVQNVLPSMEAAFIDIGKGRNAVLYAGEVNWSGLGHKDGQPRKIESVLSSGQTILVQVTKDPVGQKGARLTGQISIPGRFLVYVPDGTTSGISRKLPDTERNRLKTLLKEIVPDTAGVIVRTAAEGASEEELTRDVERLTARWADIEAKVAAGKGPELLYGEPDLTLKVVRDLFTEDFSKLVVQGAEAWELVQQYVEHVAPDLTERLERFEPDPEGPPAAQDLFAAYRVDEQIAKALDRKVWLPSGGSLIIDRTEAMTVVDVNTGKFTGSGGNLEETVTKNNLEAAEEIVRQLRLRDIGGIIVIDFIDMVLESNRDLVLRRLVECLGRDRTRHQVAEVTALGLVQMTRKRIGTGRVEAFSEECPHCKGRGLIVHHEPIATAGAASVSDDEPRGNRRRGGQRRGRGEGGNQSQGNQGNQGGQGNQQRAEAAPSPADLAGPRPPVEPLPMLNESADPDADLAPSDVEIAPSDADLAPSDVEIAPSDSETPVVDAPAPAVVTSTRRRRTATRPAGPPAATEDVVEEPAEALEPEPLPEQEEAAESDEILDEHEHSVLHVPVKKRGTRKR